MLKIENICKSYGKKRVLSDVSFALGAGEICGLLGVNGAGKSTLMRIICSLVTPSGGQLRFDGSPVKFDRTTKGIGFMIDSPSFYPNMSGKANLDILKPMYSNLSEENITAALELTGMTAQANKKYSEYSLGMKQRLYFAHCIMSKPRLLVLDEPFNGIDPVSMALFERVLKKLAADGAAILISGHYLSEIKKLANKIVIIDGGRIVHTGAIAESESIEELFLSKVRTSGDAQ